MHGPRVGSTKLVFRHGNGVFFFFFSFALSVVIGGGREFYCDGCVYHDGKLMADGLMDIFAAQDSTYYISTGCFYGSHWRVYCDCMKGEPGRCFPISMDDGGFA